MGRGRGGQRASIHDGGGGGAGSGIASVCGGKQRTSLFVVIYQVHNKKKGVCAVCRGFKANLAYKYSYVFGIFRVRAVETLLLLVWV